jgi:hypothetical protein
MQTSTMFGFHFEMRGLRWEQVLSEMYPGRLSLVLGDSKYTVPHFIEDNPDFKCNLLVRVRFKLLLASLIASGLGPTSR